MVHFQLYPRLLQAESGPQRFAPFSHEGAFDLSVTL